MKPKINLKQFYNAINKAVKRFLKNKHKILCSLGFHKYSINQEDNEIQIGCIYCGKESGE